MSKIKSTFGADPNIRDFERRFWRKTELGKLARRKIGLEKKVYEKQKKVILIIDENGLYLPRSTKAKINCEEFNKEKHGNVLIFIKQGLTVNVNEILRNAEGAKG